MATPLKLDWGKPETIAFKFDSGKDVDGRYGPQVAFTVLDESGQDHTLYLDPEPANEVEREWRNLGIRTREYFRIVKVKQPRGGSMIQLQRIAAPINGTSAPASHGSSAPALVQSMANPTTERAQVTTPPANPSFTGRVCANMCVLIDAMLEAKQYAERKGLNVTNDDLRCLATTAFIQEAKR